MPFFYDLLVGFMGSILASLVFLYYVLSYLRPKIVISPFIANYPDIDTINHPNENRFYFKIVNKSNHDAYEIRLRLCELIRWPAGNGKMHERRVDLKLRRDFQSHIPKYKKLKSTDTFAPHALVIICEANLDPILSDQNKCVELQVILRHGLTGLAKVYKYEFGDNNVVKKKPFGFGDTLTIP